MDLLNMFTVLNPKLGWIKNGPCQIEPFNLFQHENTSLFTQQKVLRRFFLPSVKQSPNPNTKDNYKILQDDTKNSC